MRTETQAAQVGRGFFEAEATLLRFRFLGQHLHRFLGCPRKLQLAQHGGEFAGRVLGGQKFHAARCGQAGDAERPQTRQPRGIFDQLGPGLRETFHRIARRLRHHEIVYDFAPPLGQLEQAAVKGEALCFVDFAGASAQTCSILPQEAVELGHSFRAEQRGVDARLLGGFAIGEDGRHGAHQPGRRFDKAVSGEFLPAQSHLQQERPQNGIVDRLPVGENARRKIQLQFASGIARIEDLGEEARLPQTKTVLRRQCEQNRNAPVAGNIQLPGDGFADLLRAAHQIGTHLARSAEDGELLRVADRPVFRLEQLRGHGLGDGVAGSNAGHDGCEEKSPHGAVVPAHRRVNWSGATPMCEAVASWDKGTASASPSPAS